MRPTSSRTRRARRALPAGLALLLLAVGCGGDDGAGGPSKVLEEAVAKTEAARTARMAVDISISGARTARFGGEAVVDFEHDRDLLTLQVAGRTLQTFNDRGEAYIRFGTSGRYRRLPASEDSPVANNPSDSLRYVGTDVVDVEEADESGCYQGMLDFDRVLDRVQEGREGEVDADLRGKRAPVVVCVDSSGRIRRYDVELSVDGTQVMTRATLSDHGRVPTLGPLGPDELPR